MENYIKQTLFAISMVVLCVLLIMGLVKVASLIFNMPSLSYEQKFERDLITKCEWNTDDNGKDHSFGDCILDVKEYLNK